MRLFYKETKHTQYALQKVMIKLCENDILKSSFLLKTEHT